MTDTGDTDFSGIGSERLLLRRFQDSDLESFVAYRSDPDIARFQSWDNFGTAEGQHFIDEMHTLNPGIPGKWFQFAIELKSEKKLIGDCALFIHTDDDSLAEIGFSLSAEFQGQGYAKEAVTSLLNYIFNDLGKRRTIAVTDTRNVKSVNLLEKIGMRREGEFVENVFFKGAWGSEYSYAILQKEWRQKQAPC